MSLSTVAKVCAGAIVGAEALLALTRDTSDTLRPPGALDERDFLARCIKCGRCIEACPYKALYADTMEEEEAVFHWDDGEYYLFKVRD